MNVGEAVKDLGKGLAAGAAGTAVMTAAQMLEMKLENRSGSNAPAEAAEKVLHLQPKTERQEALLNNAVHIGTGLSWGLARSAISLLGVRGPVAIPLHFGLVWGAELVALPALGLSPPITQWSRKQVAMDLIFHGLYAGTTSFGYAVMAGGRTSRRTQLQKLVGATMLLGKPRERRKLRLE